MQVLHFTFRLREKCVSVLLVSCSFRRKAEELLWKKGFYELTQKSKSNKQVSNGGVQVYVVCVDVTCSSLRLEKLLICSTVGLCRVCGYVCFSILL